MDDLISRKAAIDALRMDISIIPFAKAREYVRAAIEEIHNRLEELPSAQPEMDCMLKEYGDCTYSETGCSDCAIKANIKKALEAAQPEPCEDAVSRQSVISAIKLQMNLTGCSPDLMDVRDLIRKLPTVQPEYKLDEWCTDCKEYDQERHCCPRFNHVIRETVEEYKAAQPEVKPIDYRDCASALLKLWMDNILTDGEYSKIIGKLNAHQLEMPYREEGGE